MPLTLTEEQLILRATARSWLEENSPVQRMRTLRDDGAMKVLAGITSVEEVMRVTAEDQG